MFTKLSYKSNIIYNVCLYENGKELKNMIKRFAAAAVSLVLCLTMLSACSGKKDKTSSSSADSSSAADTSSASDTASAADDSAVEIAEPKLIVDGKELDTDGLVMCTVDGMDIDFDTFRFYYYYTLTNLQQNAGMTLESLRNVEGGFDMFLESVITSIKQDFVFFKFCDENSITLDEDDQKQIDEQIADLVETSGSQEEFEKLLAQEYMTEDVYRKRLEAAHCSVKCEDELFTNGGIYATSEEDFRSIIEDKTKYARIKSVYIPYSCKADITDETVSGEFDSYSLDQKINAKNSAYYALDEDAQNEAKEQAKALADEIAQKAADGEDFDELISEYGWDPAMENNEQGYYISPDSMLVSEYLDAAFELEEGQSSGVIESSSYGWFVLKRLPLDNDYIEENISSLIADYDMPSRQQIYSDKLSEMEVVYTDTYRSLDIDSIS